MGRILISVLKTLKVLLRLIAKTVDLHPITTRLRYERREEKQNLILSFNAEQKTDENLIRISVRLNA